MRTKWRDAHDRLGAAPREPKPPDMPLDRPKATKTMTSHPTQSSAHPHAANPDAVTQACVHIDAATRQLQANADCDVFSPLLALAGQLALIRGGIDPTIRAATDPNDHLGPAAHVDQALSLLDSVPPSVGPADLLVWTLRLAELREALLAAGAGKP